jgi:predicted HNH restriction endonuclease
MDESVARTIRKLDSWEKIARLKANAKSAGKWTLEIEDALRDRGYQLARVEIANATGLNIESMSPVEERIMRVVTEYVSLKRSSGSHAKYTLKQIKKRGLRGAVEASVIKPSPTEGFNLLADADLTELSYENIVLDFPDEFSKKAARYARRTLGLSESVREESSTKSISTQIWTEAVLEWLKEGAENGGGNLPRFTNAEAAKRAGIEDLAIYGRAYGNFQSRLDYACFRLGLPAVGLAAEEPFAGAWMVGGNGWEFPIEKMKTAARDYVWSSEDFEHLLAYTRKLSGKSPRLWKEAMAFEESAVKEWAFWPVEQYGLRAPTPAVDGGRRQSPNWSRDELILALELYLRSRSVPPGKDSDEVIELSHLLNRLGEILGTSNGGLYRNPNGVYMKMMNFRRFDPEFTKEGKVGLTRGSKYEEVVWNEFSADLDGLGLVVSAIRNAVTNYKVGSDDGDEEPESIEAREGRLLTRVHRIRERNRNIVLQKKKSHLSKHGRLFCEACGFDFSAAYGDEVDHIIDCHHTKPVHTMREGDLTRLEDLVLLCANCHRVVHAFSPWLTIERLKGLLKQSAIASS